MSDDINQQFIGRTEQALKDLNHNILDLKNSIDRSLAKTDILAEAIGKLPCGERRIMMENLDKTINNNSAQSKFMWVILSLFVVLCITALVKSESAEAKVNYLEKEVNTIKQVSYGYVEMKRKGGE